MRLYLTPLTANVRQGLLSTKNVSSPHGASSSSHIKLISSARRFSNSPRIVRAQSKYIQHCRLGTQTGNGLPLYRSREFATSTSTRASYQIQEHGSKISITCKDGNEEIKASYSHFWLRDNCRCSKCVNQDTMQRAFDTFSIPHDIKPVRVKNESQGLRVTWSHEEHESLVPWEWLLRHKSPSGPPKYNDKVQDGKSLWERDSSSKIIPPTVQYEDIMASDKGVGEWTAQIYKYGFCFVENCPVSPEKTQELLERIAFIRETHYGGFYDFTSDLTMKDTAYTSLALPAHTDTTYFSDPAGLQMFHMLSHTDGAGGHSLLVDGFEALTTLRKEDYEAFKILCQVPIPSHASGNDGITLTPYKYFPMFNYQSEAFMDSEFPDMVRWNNDDRGVVPLVSVGGTVTADDWYAAARKWNDIITRKQLEYWVKLEPGRALIFDNWRVMHGRSAFTGKRRMCGGYINRDDYISRWRNTNFSKEEVTDQIL